MSLAAYEVGQRPSLGLRSFPDQHGPVKKKDYSHETMSYMLQMSNIASVYMPWNQGVDLSRSQRQAHDASANQFHCDAAGQSGMKGDMPTFAIYECRQSSNFVCHVGGSAEPVQHLLGD